MGVKDTVHVVQYSRCRRGKNMHRLTNDGGKEANIFCKSNQNNMYEQ